MIGTNESEFTIEYQDAEGDKIAILDDDDLLLAYEWAQEEANGNLKLIITSQEKKKQEPAQVPAGSTNEHFVDPFQKEQDEKMSSSSSESDEDKQPDFELPQARKNKKNRGNRPGRGEKEQQKQRKMMKRIIKNAIKHQTKDLMHSIQNHNFPQQQEDSRQIVEGRVVSGGQIDSAA